MIAELILALAVSAWVFSLTLLVAGILTDTEGATGLGFVGSIFFSTFLVCCIVFGVF